MKYTVHMAVDARIDVDVDAGGPDDAYEKARAAFWDVDKTSLDGLEIVDARPVCCEDGAGAIVKEY